MSLAFVLLIIAALLIVLSIVLKNWILGACSVACVIAALLLGR